MRSIKNLVIVAALSCLLPTVALAQKPERVVIENHTSNTGGKPAYYSATIHIAGNPPLCERVIDQDGGDFQLVSFSRTTAANQATKQLLERLQRAAGEKVNIQVKPHMVLLSAPAEGLGPWQPKVAAVVKELGLVFRTTLKSEYWNTETYIDPRTSLVHSDVIDLDLTGQQRERMNRSEIRYRMQPTKEQVTQLAGLPEVHGTTCFEDNRLFYIEINPAISDTERFELVKRVKKILGR